MYELIEAAAAGNLAKARSLIGTVDINQQDKYGNTAVKNASEGGYIEILKLLVRAGADINLGNPLHIATLRGHLGIVKFLVENGADINAVNKHWEGTALFMAHQEVNVEIFNYLLSKGADIGNISNQTIFRDAPTNYGKIPNPGEKVHLSLLHAASEKGYIEVVKFFVERGDNINRKDQFGYTPIQYANENGHRELVNYIETKMYGSVPMPMSESQITDKPTPNFTYGHPVEIDDEDYGGLPMAEKYGSVPPLPFFTQSKVEDIYLDYGTLGIDSYGDLPRETKAPIRSSVETPQQNFSPKTMTTTEAMQLFLCVSNDDTPGAIQFLEAGVSPNWVDQKNGSTALIIASQRGNLELVRLLIKANADFNRQTFRGMTTALHAASENGHIEIAKELIFSGANINLCRKDNSTALHLAIEKKHFEISSFLLEKGARANAQDKDGVTPLMLATKLKLPKHIKVLLEAKADPNIATHVGKTTPIYFAAQEGDLALVQLLLTHNANPNISRNTGFSPLHVAAFKDHLEIVKLLVKHGADISCKSNEGATPSHVANWNGKSEVAFYLNQTAIDKQRESENLKQEDRQKQLGKLVRQQSVIEEKSDDNQMSVILEELRTLKKEHATLMQQHETKQQRKDANKYLESHPLLKTFYYHLQSKLTELFLGYKVLNSGLVAREESTTEDLVKTGIGLLGDNIPIPGASLIGLALSKGVEKIQETREKKLFEFIAGLVRNLSVLDKEALRASRVLTFKYEEQIKELADEKAAKKLAECAVTRMLKLMKNYNIDENSSLSQQLVSAVSTSGIKTSKKLLINFTKSIKTKRRYIEKWTEIGIFQETGIITSNGKCFSGPKSKIDIYGYRLGTKKEANDLEFLLETEGSGVTHQLADNPFRETIAPKVLQISESKIESDKGTSLWKSVTKPTSQTRGTFYLERKQPNIDQSSIVPMRASSCTGDTRTKITQKTWTKRHVTQGTARGGFLSAEVNSRRHSSSPYDRMISPLSSSLEVPQAKPSSNASEQEQNDEKKGSFFHKLRHLSLT